MLPISKQNSKVRFFCKISISLWGREIWWEILTDFRKSIIQCSLFGLWFFLSFLFFCLFKILYQTWGIVLTHSYPRFPTKARWNEETDLEEAYNDQWNQYIQLLLFSSPPKPVSIKKRSCRGKSKFGATGYIKSDSEGHSFINSVFTDQIGDLAFCGPTSETYTCY